MLTLSRDASAISTGFAGNFFISQQLFDKRPRILKLLVSHSIKNTAVALLLSPSFLKPRHKGHFFLKTGHHVLFLHRKEITLLWVKIVFVSLGLLELVENVQDSLLMIFEFLNRKSLKLSIHKAFRVKWLFNHLLDLPLFVISEEALGFTSLLEVLHQFIVNLVVF